MIPASHVHMSILPVLGNEEPGLYVSVYTACIVLYGKEAANSRARPSNPSKPLGHPRRLLFVSHGNLTIYKEVTSALCQLDSRHKAFCCELQSLAGSLATLS